LTELHPSIRVQWDAEPPGQPARPSDLSADQFEGVYELQRHGRFRALLPTLGDYPVYEPIDYYLMSRDRPRQDCYEEALQALVPGKVVVDIGTGQFAVWARTSVRLGARKVYAIEASLEASERARALVAELGLTSKIEVLHGDSGEVTLPEGADVCVSEVIGCIGSSEGSGQLMQDAARRHLKPGGAMVPSLCETRAALVTLPEAWREEPTFGPWGAYYTDRIFQAVGHPFDLRLMFFGGLDPSLLLSSDARVERLVLGEGLEEGEQTVSLEVRRPGLAYGLVLWIELWCRRQGPSLTSMHPGCTAWYPTFFPLMHPGEPVQPGDRVQLVWETRLSDDGVHPDYAARGTIERQRAHPLSFQASFPHHGALFRASPFYRRLFR
jgi:protein arginine N-methyltransferase 1